ncbi:hypothetical protein E2562_000108 [Oryza meyeriana var. granulata]|uniref:Uncharacterized protein n=1 Tax=Oryza meyeriana var. granulata TaxID=110450 RepID=A0A6G1DBF7_9ORYZ|nr:hypothetical protein E2562_000108 [Oryza meyeriana var. granulata]
MGHLLHVKPFPSPPPPHSGDLKIIKIKHLLHAFVLKHGGRLAVALGGAKALLLNIARGSVSLRDKIKRRKKTKKPRCHGGSGNDGDTMTMHLKLLLPAGVPPLTPSETAVVEPFDAELAYYDSSWNTMVPAEEQLLRPISGYLSWPEQEEEEENLGEDEEEDEQNEIDRLADKFIARCHERFMLEKQESYRRFHEMLARSL